MLRRASVFVGLLGVVGSTPSFAEERSAGPFSQGRVRVSLAAGATSSYVVLGGTVGYYVLPGLELGLGSEYWFVGSPQVITVSPQVRYVLHFVPVLKPYVGAFYQRAFVTDGFDDFDSVGARAGAFWVTRGGSYFGGGVVFQRILDCPEFTDCTRIAPEVSVSIAF